MVLATCIAGTSGGMHREGLHSRIFRATLCQLGELPLDSIHKGVDRIKPVQHGFAPSHARHSKELPALHIEESTVHENGGVISLTIVATLEGMKIRPNLDGELPLVRPSLPSLRPCLMFEGHDLAILHADEVEFDGDVSIRPHRNHPTNFGIQHFDLVSVGGVLPGVLSQSQKGVVRGLPFEPAISGLRKLSAVKREELLISGAQFTRAELILVEMFQSFVPRLTKDQMVGGILPTPPKDVFIKELPRARAEALKFGGVQNVPLIPERNRQFRGYLQHR